MFLVSDSVIKTLNRVLGPMFSKTGKFPAQIRPGNKVADAVDDAQKTVRFRSKKSTVFGVSVANDDQVIANIMVVSANSRTIEVNGIY
jgi:hypothetical protein